MTRYRVTRLLVPGAVPQAQLDRLMARHAVSSVFVASHVDTVRAARRRRPAPVLGIMSPAQELVGACWVGTNVVPIALDETGQDLVADHLARGGSRYASMFGPAEPVMGLWNRLKTSWPLPFDVRPDQPLLAMDTDPASEQFSAVSDRVRWAEVSEFSRVLPAAAAMFEEEVGYSPFVDGAQSYRKRVEQLLRDRRTAVLTDDTDGKVIFKADIGAMSGQVCQIQGVWVHPAYRGRGLAAPCMAAVVALARTYVPVVSLYVNSYNRPALATYRKVGFERSGTFATVLL